MAVGVGKPYKYVNLLQSRNNQYVMYVAFCGFPGNRLNANQWVGKVSFAPSTTPSGAGQISMVANHQQVDHQSSAK